eukprot:1732277-Lingulodinium_polyedra.AAC.1
MQHLAAGVRQALATILRPRPATRHPVLRTMGPTPTPARAPSATPPPQTPGHHAPASARQSGGRRSWKARG